MGGIVLLVDGIIALTLVEFAVLIWLYRRRRSGISPNEIGLNIASGLALMIALRIALTEGQRWAMLACLATAGLLHGLDIIRRWRR